MLIPIRTACFGTVNTGQPHSRGADGGYLLFADRALAHEEFADLPSSSLSVRRSLSSIAQSSANRG